jgi:DNA-binding NtrC family response regulator
MPDLDERMTLAELVQERRDTAILGALEACQGNLRRTAAALGMSLRNLLYVMQQMRERGIAIPSRKARP